MHSLWKPCIETRASPLVLLSSRSAEARRGASRPALVTSLMRRLEHPSGTQNRHACDMLLRGFRRNRTTAKAAHMPHLQPGGRRGTKTGENRGRWGCRFASIWQIVASSARAFRPGVEANLAHSTVAEAGGHASGKVRHVGDGVGLSCARQPTFGEVLPRERWWRSMDLGALTPRSDNARIR